jgi:Xaa-Pro aminopeptidase
VGCFGYYADFSRTFHSGPERPTAAQRALYRTAHEQVTHNLGILRPGMSFRDYADAAWDIPPQYFANRYYLSAHGCGMTGEYPYLYHRADFPDAGYDGEIVPGMVLCVESFIGEEGRGEGVKLEQQVLVTETGIEPLSTFPFEESLLAP